MSYEILNIPNGIEVIDKTDSGFKLKIPKTLLEGKTELEVNNIRVRGIFSEQQAIEYKTNDDTIQRMTLLSHYTEASSKDSVSFKIKVPMGYIEVNKVDSDYSNIKLEGVKFEIRDNNNTLIETLITNSNGYAKSKALIADGKTYTLKEIETKEDTVKADFREIDEPRLYCDMLDNLPNGFVFVNHTKVSGNYKDKYIEDTDDWKTITYYKEIELSEKLPRTGGTDYTAIIVLGTIIFINAVILILFVKNKSKIVDKRK